MSTLHLVLVTLRKVEKENPLLDRIESADHNVALLILHVCSEKTCEQDIWVKYEEDVVRAQR